MLVGTHFCGASEFLWHGLHSDGFADPSIESLQAADQDCASVKTSKVTAVMMMMISRTGPVEKF